MLVLESFIQKFCIVFIKFNTGRFLVSKNLFKKIELKIGTCKLDYIVVSFDI